jgi:hypothetical protein
MEREPTVAGGTEVNAGNQRRPIVHRGMSVIDRSPGQRKLSRSAVPSLKNGVGDISSVRISSAHPSRHQEKSKRLHPTLSGNAARPSKRGVSRIDRRQRPVTNPPKPHPICEAQISTPQSGLRMDAPGWADIDVRAVGIAVLEQRKPVGDRRGQHAVESGKHSTFA